MAIDKFGWPTPHPSNKNLHLGVLPDCFRGVISRGQFFFGKKGVEFAVADQMQRLCLPVAPGLGLPVVPVDTGPGDHLPAADRAWSQTLP